MRHKPTFIDRLDQGIFNSLYSRSLVYNTCWEDPAVDRQALNLGADDTLLVISSAGCNALDYALAGVRKIHAVDANPRQIALLELKLAGVRHADYVDFFKLFGLGYHAEARELYRDSLRSDLSPFAREYWDRNIGWFASRAGSFYFHGLSGLVARAFRTYFRLRPALADQVFALFEAESVEQQREIYDHRIRPMMWGRAMNWALSQQFTMSLLGVPYPQRREVQAQHADGVAGFIRESVEYVFRELPAGSNYFWQVYVRGHYTPACCPEYLKRENFVALKAGLAERIQPRVATVTDFLRESSEPISRFVLLDHMDWMASYHPDALVEEWNEILRRAAPQARIIFRSAHERPRYLEWIEVGEARQRLHEVLHFHDELAMALQRQDRVHTYAGFHIADLAATA